ncbi:unnamed protein product [Caenorhabditis auriculariae]|uniref:Uncharacterized protein n=1 Tax=Caenorhabditis auriculariae TaxID=2777116 RepID=A0A8S1H6V4_9PELO|nr:unnamed protein product [Caenorhabditis auriculariae]
MPSISSPQSLGLPIYIPEVAPDTSTMSTTTTTLSLTAKKSTMIEPTEVQEEDIGCQLSDITFAPPKISENEKEGVLEPVVECSSPAKIGCNTAKISCEIPMNSEYPLVAVFAKINGVDWATTDLMTSKAETELLCAPDKNWTYVSDIPSLIGLIYDANQVFCLLVPQITNDYEYVSDLDNSEAL